MLSKLFTGGKTVSNVLASFNKTLSDLRDVELFHEAEAVRQAQVIAEARATHDASIAEASLARDVASKLNELFSPLLANTTIEELKQEASK